MTPRPRRFPSSASRRPSRRKSHARNNSPRAFRSNKHPSSARAGEDEGFRPSIETGGFDISAAWRAAPRDVDGSRPCLPSHQGPEDPRFVEHLSAFSVATLDVVLEPEGVFKNHSLEISLGNRLPHLGYHPVADLPAIVEQNVVHRHLVEVGLSSGQEKQVG